MLGALTSLAHETVWDAMLTLQTFLIPNPHRLLCWDFKRGQHFWNDG
jgi:hypothetical protein